MAAAVSPPAKKSGNLHGTERVEQNPEISDFLIPLHPGGPTACLPLAAGLLDDKDSLPIDSAARPFN